MTIAHNIAWGLVRIFFWTEKKTKSDRMCTTWTSTIQIEFTRGTVVLFSL